MVKVKLRENVMKPSQIPSVLLPLALSLVFASCTPVAEPHDASISGGVYFDCDMNGACDKEECGIENMPVRLYSGACGENLLQTHLTSELGKFQFSELEPGEYCVFPDFEMIMCGYAGNFPTTEISRQVTLESGTKADLVWFGFGKLSGEQEP
jgi:hypothetical protein